MYRVLLSKKTMNSSSEQRLIEQMHDLAKSVRALEVVIREKVLPDVAELHGDVKSLLGFRAQMLGWAAGVSAVISAAMTWLLATLRH